MIVLFDPHCLLCSRTVAIVLANDRSHSIRFASTTSKAGRDLARRHGLSDEDLDHTFVAIDDDRALLRSDAAIAIARRLKFPFPLLVAIIVLLRLGRAGTRRREDAGRARNGPADENPDASDQECAVHPVDHTPEDGRPAGWNIATSQPSMVA